MKSHPVHLDCTLRDGGYYNAWDFAPDLVSSYLSAMQAAAVDIVEIGFRSLKNRGFNGAFAYTTDELLESLPVPEGMRLGVMVNAAEIAHHPSGISDALDKLFRPAADSPIEVVRLAVHYKDLEATLQATQALSRLGYVVGVNLMQISAYSPQEIRAAGALVEKYKPDVFYFADSMGCLLPNQVKTIVSSIRETWSGAIGIHAHDNLGNALANTLTAHDVGATWLDSTVTGMGRGPGNTMTEYLAIELAERREIPCDATELLALIRRHFAPMKANYGWGTNPHYYLAGKFGIHPTYIQEMLGDARYSDEDILAVIEHLKGRDAAKYDAAALETGRHFYHGEVTGQWQPATLIDGREVLIVGAGPSVSAHVNAIESYIRRHAPFVIALNTEDRLAANLIDVRAACHPVRMLADCARYGAFPQPLATPASMLPDSVRQALSHTQLLDYGLKVNAASFECAPAYCILPTSLVVAYALAVATSGGAQRILLAGLDGYSADDPRRTELDQLFARYADACDTDFASVTPTKLEIPSLSIYAL